MKNNTWIKKNLILLTSIMFLSPAFAFEDYILMSDGKLTDIKIQHNDIIDVYPMITILNDKNTLIIHPLKEGSTKFTVVKNDKEKFLFNVDVNENNTTISSKEGFEMFSVDTPPGNDDFSDLDIEKLDEPPFIKNFETDEAKTDFDQNTNDALFYRQLINSLNLPLKLRGDN